MFDFYLVMFLKWHNLKYQTVKSVFKYFSVINSVLFKFYNEYLVTNEIYIFLTLVVCMHVF